MTLPGANQTITVIRVGPSPGDDDYGNPLPGELEPHDITGCSFQPLLGVASMENVSQTFDQVMTRWRFFAPAGSDVVASDHIQVDGVDYQVDGDPVTWPDVNGLPHHVEGYAKKWAG